MIVTEGSKEMKICRYCHIEIEREGDRWVDIEEGGVYDFCTERKYGEQESGHRPSPADGKLPEYEVSGNVVYRKGKIFGSFDPIGGITIPDYWDRIAWEIDVQVEFAAIEEEAVKYLQEGSKS